MVKQVLPVFEQYVKKPTFLGKKNLPFPEKFQMHAICRMRIAQKTITYRSTLLLLLIIRILFRMIFGGYEKILNPPKMGKNDTKKETLNIKIVKKSSKPQRLDVLSNPYDLQRIPNQVLAIF